MQRQRFTFHSPIQKKTIRLNDYYWVLFSIYSSFDMFLYCCIIIIGKKILLTFYCSVNDFHFNYLETLASDYVTIRTDKCDNEFAHARMIQSLLGNILNFEVLKWIRVLFLFTIGNSSWKQQFPLAQLWINKSRSFARQIGLFKRGIFDLFLIICELLQWPAQTVHRQIMRSVDSASETNYYVCWSCLGAVQL